MKTEKHYTSVSESEAKRMRNAAVDIGELTKGFTGEPATNAMKSCLEMANYVLILTNKL